MAAGPKSERISIERVMRTKRADGGFDEATVTVGSLWAEAAYAGGGESDQRGAIRSTRRYRFTVHAAAVKEMGVVATDTIVWRGERFNIREAPRDMPSQSDLTLFAESGVAM